MATILVVDDRPSNREFLTTLLGYGGHRLLEAADGAEALNLVRSGHPDLVITDILMPTMDGYEFVQSVRADSDPGVASTPVIFYTATYSAPQAEELAKSCGVSKVLPKPSEPQAILAAVNDALGLRETPAAPSPVGGGRAGAATRPADDTMTLFARDLEDVKLGFESLASGRAKPGAGRDAVRDLSRKFAENVANMQRVTMRLSALIEVGMEMMAERDPARLIELFFAAACDLVDADYAAVGMLDHGEQEVRHVFAKGFDAGLLRGEAGRKGLFAVLLSGRAVLRKPGTKGMAAEGLPEGHPKVQDLLGLPVSRAGRTYGWIYFAGRRGQAGFSDEDARVATVMTRKLALLYENAMLYDDIQRHAAELQIEAAVRKQAEIKIRSLNRVYAVLSGINTLIVRVRDRDELFREACRVAVEQGLFKMAWIGVVDREAMKVVPVASAGAEPEFLALIKDRFSLSGDDAMGNTLTARAIREKRAMVSNEIRGDTRILFARERAERGICSMAILPLLVGEDAVGVLALYADQIGFFDGGEMKLLLELAGDISFALEHIGKTEKLDYLAYYDELTGLANRSLFLQRLEQQVNAARGAGRQLAVTILDIERFKAINDAHGRQAGDALLKQVADRIVRLGGDASRFARIGADHIAAVTVEMESEEHFGRRTEERLNACFGPPYQVAGQAVRISAKAGIAVFPNDGADADILLRNAEAALKKAKAGGDRYLFYTQKMTERVAERLALENELRQAAEKEEFVLHYQPKVDLETRAIVGVEALIRWQSPERGLVPPLQFIPLLEEIGLILEVGSWALKRAALDHRGWVERKLKAPRIAVNVSQIQLRHRDFVDIVQRAIMEGVIPGGIDLEITESLVMDDIEANIGKLNELRVLGIAIAIDDFGTGYSSLAYLAKLPVATLKIDRAFIVKMAEDPIAATLVQTMISLAHSLQLKVVAEGVETEEQAKMLRLLGCDQMQGYLFSRPLPLEEMTALLRPAAEIAATRVA